MCVVYSATKHIDGQGRCLGGVILASEKFIQDNIHQFIRQTGPSMSPFNAWVLLKGLETLHLRVRRQTDTAAAVDRGTGGASQNHAADLSRPRPDHPQADVVQRQMCGGSTLVAIEVGRRQGGERSASSTRSSSFASPTIWATPRASITHPATTTHQRLTPEARAELGITDGTVRFSAGLEHPDDIVGDLLTALEQA